tara:strand:+ start:7190 stop:8437 length:1248 start_codon:yes stop_codon:yes gene_type:complete
MSKTKQHWLIIAHCFNMDGRAASRVVTDRVSLFLEHNIEPIIVSAATGAKLDQFQHYQVISWAPSGLRFELRHMLANRRWVRLIFNVLISPFYWIERLFIRLDSQWSWFASAYIKGSKLVREKNISVVYSSGGAISAHIVALLIKRKYSSVWIAEFHDPIGLREIKYRGRSRGLYDWLEQKICDSADHLLFTTKAAKALAKKRYDVKGELHTVYAGVDPTVEKLSSERKFDGDFVITHIGSLAGRRNLKCLMRALELIYSQPRQMSLSIRLYGTIESSVRADVAKSPLEHLVQFEGTVPSSKVGQTMAESDLLLLVHGGQKIVAQTTIPSKVFEYLHSSRPVFALVQDNHELYEILKDAGAYVAHALDAEDIADVLNICLKDYESQNLRSVSAGAFSATGAVRKIVSLADRNELI